MKVLKEAGYSQIDIDAMIASRTTQVPPGQA